jgi:hypothetical protein
LHVAPIAARSDFKGKERFKFAAARAEKLVMPLILPMTRLAALLAVGVSLFAAYDENSKAVQIRRIINDLKAAIAQLENQISGLEAQLGDAAQPAAAATASSRPGVNGKVRGRCAATTKRGTRCSRPAVAGKRTCWQH